MSKISENEEERLRRLYVSELAPGETLAAERADDAVRQVVRTANARTGVRDVVALTVSSWFAVLLVFFAPLAMRAGKTGARKPRGESRPES